VHKANRGYNAEFARLAPLMRWDDGWVPVVDAVEEYPDEGLVYWARPKGVRLERGQAWLVELEDRPDQEDTYRVRTGSKPVRPWEAVSVPGTDGAVELRRALARRVFELTPSPAGLALIACPDRPDVWLAPFEAHGARNGSFEYNFSSGFARLLALDSAKFFDATIDGVPRRLIDGAALVPQPRGAFTIQSDEDLIAGLERRLRRWDRKALDALGVTQSVLDLHVRTLARAGDAEPTGQDEARQAAVNALLTAAAASRESARQLAEAVAHHPAVADALNARFAEEADRRRGELEAEFATRRAEFEARVAREVADSEERLTELRHQHSEVERGIEALEAELAQAVERQVAGGLPRLADHMLTRVLLGKQSAPVATPPDANAEVAPAVRRLDSVEALRNAAGARALASGLDPLLATTAAGLILGRRCLLVGGAAAVQLSTALAETLAGSRIYRVRTSATHFSVSDLLAVPVAGVGASEVVPLGDRLAEAAASGEVAVLILHGCNRAPPEGALADLVDAVTPGAGGLSAPWTDRYGVARVAPLDRRLLVVGTLTEGSTSFRVSEALATRVPLIDADRRLVQVDLHSPDAPVETTAVGDALWESLARSEATVEEVREWRAVTGEAGSGLAIRRYLGITSTVLPKPGAAFESLLAMTIGRPTFERPEVARLLSASGTSDDELQASHRRLECLIERRGT
jgi:hypothetical protein